MNVEQAEQLLKIAGYRTFNDSQRLIVRTKANEYVIAFVVEGYKVNQENLTRFLSETY